MAPIGAKMRRIRTNMIRPPARIAVRPSSILVASRCRSASLIDRSAWARRYISASAIVIDVQTDTATAANMLSTPISVSRETMPNCATRNRRTKAAKRNLVGGVEAISPAVFRATVGSVIAGQQLRLKIHSGQDCSANRCAGRETALHRFADGVSTGKRSGLPSTECFRLPRANNRASLLS